jgi:hypothetical protein
MILRRICFLEIAAFTERLTLARQLGHWAMLFLS